MDHGDVFDPGHPRMGTRRDIPYDPRRVDDPRDCVVVRVQREEESDIALEADYVGPTLPPGFRLSSVVS